MNRVRYSFKFYIGDWSADGHGKCDTFFATAAKPIDDVREAYFAAKTKLPERLCPESYACNYEDATIPDDVVSALRALGCPVPNDDAMVGSDEMAAIVVWWINQGDPDVDVRLTDIPALEFLGYDERGRHIGSFGYGVMGS